MRRMTTIDLSQDNGGKVFVCRTLRMSQVATGTHRLPRNRDYLKHYYNAPVGATAWQRDMI